MVTTSTVTANGQTKTTAKNQVPTTHNGLAYPSLSDISSSSIAYPVAGTTKGTTFTPGGGVGGTTRTVGSPETSRSSTSEGPSQHSTLTQNAGTTNSREPKSHTPQAQSSGLSTGAAIGIGVAIAVFVVALLCALGFFCYRRHVRRKRAGQHDQPSQVFDDHAKDESVIATSQVKGDAKYGVVGLPYELSGKPRAGELETSANRHELDARSRDERAHELPGESGERKFP